MDSHGLLKSKVSSKGWVVIPALLRKRFGIEPGTSIEFQEIGERIVLIPESKDPVDALYGKLAGKRSLTKALLEERTKEMRREEARVRIG
jgi:AbrB family looped-hinge helix DNA binding protein